MAFVWNGSRALGASTGLFVLFTGVLAAACSGTPAPGDNPQPSDSGSPSMDSGLGIGCTGASPSFGKDVEPIFANRCGGSEICHGGLIGIGGHMPSPIWPYDSLVNVQASRDGCTLAGDLVKPGDLRDSYLMHKLTGVAMCPETNRMPVGSELPRAEIQTVADWICSGAKND